MIRFLATRLRQQLLECFPRTSLGATLKGTLLTDVHGKRRMSSASSSVRFASSRFCRNMLPTTIAWRLSLPYVQLDEDSGHTEIAKERESLVTRRCCRFTSPVVGSCLSLSEPTNLETCRRIIGHHGGFCIDIVAVFFVIFSQQIQQHSPRSPIYTQHLTGIGC